MAASYSKAIPDAFVLNEAALRRLCKLLTDRIGDVEITVSCIDDVTREFSSVTDLIAYENAASSRIKRLKVHARASDYGKYASVDFRGDSLAGVDINASAREDVLDRLRSDVLDIVDGIKPLYSILYRAEPFGILIPGILSYACLMWAFLTAVPALGIVPGSFLGIMLVLIWVVAGVGSFFIVDQFRASLLPRAVFLIGQGKARHARLTLIQQGVLWSIVVPVILTIILASWPTAKLPKNAPNGAASGENSSVSPVIDSTK